MRISKEGDRTCYLAGQTSHFTGPKVVYCLVTADKKYHAHLISNSNLNRIINVIKNKLSNGMNNLLASWIGKFFEIKTIQFCGRLINHLFLHQVECEDKNVIKFDFNSTEARFDMKYLVMITELNCSKFPCDSELKHLPYDLWIKFFGKRGPMTQGEFSKAFDDLDFDEKEVVDNVKCYMFYFRETVLLGGDKKRLYTVKNELHPTKEEIQQTYMKTFWHRPSDKKYYGLPVFRVEASQSQPTMLPSLASEGTKDASLLEFQHTSTLEMQIEEMRSDREEEELPDTADWEKEMNDSPFIMYALGTLPVGSKSSLEVDYVKIPTNIWTSFMWYVLV
ncbi:hypothetical protein FNV43_RR14797 [Rhamnella rubrinervis]|uniref:Uncharacterized protein n=1 Tax=Rhamnella rubrinervis TaxID=2594499 RepID=A0A8K0H3S6_9ROSA|nr:hypothetical protein FNV43_RR14797 [Rhamnella rubrinervis]